MPAATEPQATAGGEHTSRLALRLSRAHFIPPARWSRSAGGHHLGDERDQLGIPGLPSWRIATTVRATSCCCAGLIDLVCCSPRFPTRLGPGLVHRWVTKRPVIRKAHRQARGCVTRRKPGYAPSRAPSATLRASRRRAGRDPAAQAQLLQGRRRVVGIICGTGRSAGVKPLLGLRFWRTIPPLCFRSIVNAQPPDL